MAKRSPFEQLDEAVQALLAQPQAPVPPRDPKAIAPLTPLASDLRDLPRAEFKFRLKADLQRSISMITKSSSDEETHPVDDVEQPAAAQPGTKRVNPIRPGFRTITPYLIVNEAAELIDFVKTVFGAKEDFRSTGSAGGIHCEVRIGESVMMIGGGSAWRGTPSPTALHVYVPDVDATYQRALQAGATSLRAPADQSYGDRDASIRDPYGNHWYIGTHKERGASEYLPEGLLPVTVYLHPKDTERTIDFLEHSFGAEEIQRAQEPSGGVIHHAKLRIGTSILEMGEAHAEFQPMPTTFFLYVEDCDALYRRALTAGATSLTPPADQPYGDRTAGVHDPFGNTWYLATHIKDVAP
jgi:PhnB protein